MRTAIVRLLLVPCGLAAGGIAGFAVAAAAVIRDFDRIAETNAYAPDQVLLLGAIMLLVAGPVFLAAGLAFAVVGEALAVRSWVFYVASGLAIALVGCRMFTLSGEDGLFGDEVAAAAGIAAGLAHWLVAGRSAGFAAAAPDR